MSSSVREQVRELIQPLITGNRWSVKPHTVRQVQTLSRPTVFIEHTGMDQLAAAPIGNVENTCVVTIVSHRTDYAQAEDELDAKVMDLIEALDGSVRLNWTEARKVEVADTYLAWAITLTLTTEKETTS